MKGTEEEIMEKKRKKLEELSWFTISVNDNWFNDVARFVKTVKFINWNQSL